MDHLRALNVPIERRLCILAAAALLLGLLLAPRWAPSARAGGPWYAAPSGSDANDCLTPASACATIAAAAGRASAGDTIFLAPGSYAERLTLRMDLTLRGAGAPDTIIDGAAGGTVITIFPAKIDIAGVTIRNGRGIGAGGGITNYGTLSLAASSVSENVVVAGEGFQGYGGGIANYGTLAITGTSVLSNTGAIGGGIYNRGALTLLNSTLSGNAASGDGGGLANVQLGQASVRFTTIAGNIADADQSGAGDGGGVLNAATSTLSLDRALLGGNADRGGQAPDCAGALASAGRSLIQDGSGCTLAGAGDVVGQDARLGALAANGGPTLTHALLTGSPAIDAGDNGACPAADQRGVARPQGPACDIGAYEAAQPARGRWYVAPQGSDANDCASAATACQTIRAAVAKSSAGDEVDVAAGTYTETVTLNHDLLIAGAGADATIVDGGAAGSVITVIAARVAIANLTIRNGRGIGAGGGVSNFGALSLAGSRVSDNRAVQGEGFQGFGGGIANFGTLQLSDTGVLSNTAFFGGGIYNSGTLTITTSSLANNTVLLGQGFQGGMGGGIANLGRLSLRASSVISNTASSGDASAGPLGRWLPGIGGGIANLGRLDLADSSVISNTAAFGGGLTNLGRLTASNSTLSGNAARHDGGGLANSAAATAELTSLTIANNVADSDQDGSGAGGGVSNEISGTVVLSNTLLGGNADRGGQAPDCAGALTSAGHNLVQDGSGCALAGAGDIVGQEARLGALAANGGPTLTHALMPGSPAIDAGDNRACPAADQRGVARPQGPACDIGAYEYRPPGLLSASNRVYLALVERLAAAPRRGLAA